MPVKKPFAKKVALVTGATSGIGDALVQELLGLGHTVVATARRADALEKLRRQGADAVQLDLDACDQIAAVIANVAARHSRIDLLINNAGYGLMAPLLDVPPEAMAAQFQTNVFAPLELVRQVAPLMRAQGGGVIANIGSVSGVMPTPFAGAYCASKAAFNALSDVLRMELAPFGIHVVSVQPGAIRSGFGAAASKGAGLVTVASWYAPMAAGIARRAMSSQHNAMPADEFARQLLRGLLAEEPPAVVRLGPQSMVLPALKAWLPEKIIDRLLKQRFGLRAGSA
jgi:short-subunit dehydrogenase